MNGRSIRFGAAAAAGLTAFYIAVVWGASGSLQHLLDQARDDAIYLALIIGGFGTQIALVSELRRRHRLQHGAALAGAAGASASTAGMIACCAHHIADLAPFIGATGSAGFLTDYRIPFMLLGIGINATGVTIAARRLHTLRLPPHDDRHLNEGERCNAAA